LSISVRLRNLVRGGLGPIWAISAIEEEEDGPKDIHERKIGSETQRFRK
jgi:hypothetical protein